MDQSIKDLVYDKFVDTVTKIFDNGNKITAIKYVRDELNVGLKEAKDFIEENIEYKRVKVTYDIPRKYLVELTSFVADNIANYLGPNISESELPV